MKIKNSDLNLEETRCIMCNSKNYIIEAEGIDYLHEVSGQSFYYVSCKDCRHLYLNPRPCLTEVDRLYPSDYSTFTKKFSKDKNILASAKQFVLMQRFKYLKKGLNKNASVLDIGCGDLSFLKGLRVLYPDLHLYGLDWNFTNEAKLEAERHSINLLLGVAENHQLENGSMDLIIMNQLIEHLWDPDAVLRATYGALKKGGRLAIETPNPNGWDRIFFKKGGWGSYYWPRHLNLFSRAHLTELLQRSGFKIEFTDNLVAPPCWIYSLQFSLIRCGYTKRVKKIFADDSLILLAIFSVVDSFAKFFGMTTSNQKIIGLKQ